MTEKRGFVVKAELEGVNVSEIRPLKEAMLLVVGITGLALTLFVLIAVVVEFSAPLIPPHLEYRLFRNRTSPIEPSIDGEKSQIIQRAERVLEQLQNSGSASAFPIRIAIQESDGVNAFAVPGGLILVTTGLMDEIANDQELAFVIGHELGHFSNRDHLRGLGRGVAVIVVSGVLGATGVGTPVLKLIDHFDLLASRSMDRQQEIAADSYGLKLLEQAHGDPSGAANFLSRLEKEGETRDSWLDYLETHPVASERIKALSEAHPPEAEKAD